MSKVVPRKVEILAKFKVDSFFKDVEVWELKKYDDGDIAVAINGRLYGQKGLDKLIKGLTKVRKLMKKKELK